MQRSINLAEGYVNQKTNYRLILAGVVLLIAACGGSGEATPPASSNADLQYGEAPVEDVEVRLLESFPLQVQLHVEGYLPDGCTEIDSTKVELRENHFTVTIMTARPVDMACTEAIEAFELNIPLDVYGLPAGEYTVDVNSVEASFTFKQDNILE
jgi:inhibitor of cysteine peptidase